MNRPPSSALIRCAAFPLALIVAVCAWMGYYDYRAFGSPLTPPYKIDRATYAMAPYYVWQSDRPEPSYRHTVMRNFYYTTELDYFRKIHSPTGFWPASLIKAVRVAIFFAGFALLPPLIMMGRVIRDRRMRFMLICLCIMTAGLAIEIFLIPH